LAGKDANAAPGLAVLYVANTDKPVVILEIPAALQTPVQFSGAEFICIGSLKKRLKDYPEKNANCGRC
jgi:hypothetical protein